jgi:hypothetical protein
VATGIWIAISPSIGGLRVFPSIGIGIAVGYGVSFGSGKHYSTLAAGISVVIAVLCICIGLFVTQAYNSPFGLVFSVLAIGYGARRAWLTPIGLSR